MRIYISIPITGHDYEQQKAKAKEVADFLKEQGQDVFNPFEKNGEDPNADYAEVLGQDITGLLKCDAAIFCGAWWHSKGCKLEHQCAKIYGKKRFNSLKVLSAWIDEMKGKNDEAR